MPFSLLEPHGLSLLPVSELRQHPGVEDSGVAWWVYPGVAWWVHRGEMVGIPWWVGSVQGGIYTLCAYTSLPPWEARHLSAHHPLSPWEARHLSAHHSLLSLRRLGTSLRIIPPSP